MYCLGDPFKQMDLSSKCAAELEKHGQGYCLEKGWTAACPHSCRGTSLIFYLSTENTFSTRNANTFKI